MLRLDRLCSLPLRGYRLAVVFSAGLAGGMAIGLTVQSRPVPAAPQPAVVEGIQGTGAANVEAPAGSRPPASAFRAAAPIPADVLRVIDGDTFEARVHAWPGLDVTTKVRLRGIDAPELRARCPMERIKAEAARDALTEILTQGAVGVYGISIDKYGGRVVADAATHSIASVSAEMLKRGHARSYTGGHRDGWCDR
jgi:endonuclease YncB( thermonuclease family)